MLAILPLAIRYGLRKTMCLSVCEKGALWREILNLTQNLLIVDLNVFEAPVTLSWKLDGLGSIYIWTRKNGGQWIRAESSDPALPGDPFLWRNPGNRAFIGDVGIIEAIAFGSASDNPNSDPSPEIAIDRCLILNRSRNILNDERFFPAVTGTSVAVRTRADQPPSVVSDRRSFAIFQVDTTEPIQDINKPAGLFEFAQPPMLTMVQNYNLVHAMEIADRLLFPGNNFWGLLTLVDIYGQWQCFKFPFRTLRRTVVVTFDEIHIINDGSEQHNDAEFYVWLTEGWVWAGTNSIHIPELEISDRPSPGEEGMEHIKLIGPGRFAGPIILGPSVIVPEQERDAPNFNKFIGNEFVAALAYGSAEGDGIGDPHDRAANFEPAHVLDGIRPIQKLTDGFLRFPVGSAVEAVTKRHFEFICSPQTDGNEFEFSLIGTFSVSYAP